MCLPLSKFLATGLNKCLILGECDTPEFIYPIDNITVAAGRDAHFTCVVNKLQGHKVMMCPKKISILSHY